MTAEGAQSRTTVQEPGDRSVWPIWPEPSWKWLLVLGLLSRLLVVAWGDWRYAGEQLPAGLLENEREVAVPNRQYNTRHLAALAAPARRWAQPWYRWDAIWYAEVSQSGYAFDPQRQSSTAFLPLLPMVMATGAAIGLDRYWVGLLACNMAFVAGLICFGRATLRVTGDKGTTWRACLLLTAFPYGVFFSAPYQESLGFALTAAALVAWQAGRPIAAAASLAWASLARLTTVAMALGLIAEWLDDLVRRRPARHMAWAVALASGLGIGLFCVYLGLHVGDPFAHFRAHSAWRHTASAANLILAFSRLFELWSARPWLAVVSLAALSWGCLGPVCAGLVWFRAWFLGERPAPQRISQRERRRSKARARRRDNAPVAAPEPSDLEEARAGKKGRQESIGPGEKVANAVALGFIGIALSLAIPGNPLYPIVEELCQARMAEVPTMCLFVGLGVHAWWRRGPLWGCLVLVPLIQGLATGTTLSMTRIVLAAFPAFVDLAELLRPRVAFVAWMGISLVAQALLIESFVNWGYLG
jgi:hypothetical protein